MAYVNTACAGRVTIFSTGGKFRLVSNFTWLHALTLAARSYVLLTQYRTCTLGGRIPDMCMECMICFFELDHPVLTLHYLHVSWRIERSGGGEI